HRVVFFDMPAPHQLSSLSLHDALPISPDGLAFLVFDWENAGWGVPVTDLCQFTWRSTLSPDLSAYGASLAETARGRPLEPGKLQDRKSTRLNSSHVSISYAVFCLKKKT